MPTRQWKRGGAQPTRGARQNRDDADGKTSIGQAQRGGEALMERACQYGNNTDSGSNGDAASPAIRERRRRGERSDFEQRKTPTRQSPTVFFVAPRIDEDGNGTKKQKAIVSTNNRGQYWLAGVAEGEYHVNLLEPEPGNEVRVHNTGCGREQGRRAGRRRDAPKREKQKVELHDGRVTSKNQQVN